MSTIEYLLAGATFGSIKLSAKLWIPARKIRLTEGRWLSTLQNMKPAICIEMLYPGLPAEEKIRKVAKHGFSFVEFWGHKDKDLEAVARACADTGVKVVNFSAHRRGDLIDRTTHGLILADFEESLKAANTLDVSTLMVLSNELGEGGRVVRRLDHLKDEEKETNSIAGLKTLMAMAPRNMTIVLEPLNTRIDHAGNYLASTSLARDILGEVGDARLKILCDFYHMGVMGEFPPDTARKYASHIGHVHIADYPGRHEPGTGRGPWKETLRELRDSGYEGYVGFEFSPSGDSGAALEMIKKLWKSAVESP
jgi:hydroxypyruvate isomerase